MSTPPASAQDTDLGGQSLLLRLIRSGRLTNTTFVVLVLVMLTIVFTIGTDGRILSARSINLLLTYGPELMLITMGIGIVLIVGELDLSIGSIYVFCSVLTAVLVRDFAVPLPAAVLAGMAFGTLLGAVNGLIVVKTGVTSFIITLGGMWAYKGIMLLLVGGGSIAVYPEPGEQWIFQMLAGKVFGIPMQAIWLCIFAFLLTVVLSMTRTGNWLRATGSNDRAARMMGVPVGLMKVFAFSASGMLCGVAGVIQVSHSNHAIPQSGDFVMLTALAGAIVGGISLKGGKGSVVNAFLGGLLLQVIGLGFVMIGVVEYWTNVMTASAIVGTAILYNWTDRLRVSR